MAEKDKEAQSLQRVIERLDMFDQRLDNIDSIVSAVVERVMKQSVILNVTCSRCGHSTEIAIVGVAKPSR
ncbi:MAG: hypothetical protein PHR43_04245 [Dehalococcoidales bacterium]|nr:hypothetical protein [Dehalococcoidales bacterium]